MIDNKHLEKYGFIATPFEMEKIKPYQTRCPFALLYLIERENKNERLLR